MKSIIVYWSATGHTESVANVIFDQTKQKGFESILNSVSDCNEDLSQFDKIFLGCPAMGAEELEDSEFAPFYESVKSKLQGKEVVLFGTYDWGDGEWMRNWVEDATSCGIKVFNNEGLIVQDDEEIEQKVIDFISAYI